AHGHVEAGVAQVQRVRAALAAVADDRDLGGGAAGHGVVLCVCVNGSSEACEFAGSRSFLLITFRSEPYGCRKQKTPRLPVRGSECLASVCCLHAGSSRTCWRGNKDDEKERARAEGGGVLDLGGGRVAMQHGSQESTPFPGLSSARGGASTVATATVETHHNRDVSRAPDPHAAHFAAHARPPFASSCRTMPDYRSRTSTHGRNMAGARALWRATGMKDGDFQKPIVAIANSFTQFVPGHVHLKDLGQLVAREIERVGGVAKEFNTIAVDDGIAMGHDGM